MWPPIGEAVSRAIHAEAAVSDLVSVALSRWLPGVTPHVLPSLTAAGELPPDPAAVAETQPVWDMLTQELILAGVSMLWAVTYSEASDDMPGVPTLAAVSALLSSDDFDPEVLRAVADNSGIDTSRVVEILSAVRARPDLSEILDDFLETQRPVFAAVPGRVQMAVEAAVREATAPAAPALPPETPLADVQLLVQSTLKPEGLQMRQVARAAGHQSAAVQNHAVLIAAQSSTEVLHKVWICTIDGKTRASHWAADGQRVALDGAFTIGGEQLRFPADPTGTPAEVKNCRCRMGVLAEDEPLPAEVDRHTERLDGRDATARNRQGSQQDEIDRRRDAGNVRARDDADGIGRTAAGGWVAPSSQEYGTVDTTENMFRTFTDQPVAFVGTPTSDGRILAAGIALTMRTFPHPLMWCEQNEGGHFGSYTVGVIETAEVRDGTVYVSGYVLNTDDAERFCGQLGHQITSPSVDLAGAKWKATDRYGNELTEAQMYDEDTEVFITITEAELIGVTMVATAAFGDTRLELNPEREVRDVAMVASAQTAFRPLVFDPQLFADPQLTGPTRLTITEDGHIFGHIACFGQCHRSIQAECIMAPRSHTEYAQFHTSPPVHLSDGQLLPVGRLTVGTGHAPEHLPAGPAAAHYDNTGSCFAIGRAGEDAFGVWFSGVAAPWATPETVQMGLMSPLSGDWRYNAQAGGLELVAALAVNTPGFVAAIGREDSEGRPATLVASLAPSGPDPDTGMRLTPEQLSAAIRDGVAEALARAQTATVDAAAQTRQLMARATGGAAEAPSVDDLMARV